MPARRGDHRDQTATIGNLHLEPREQRREIQRLREENDAGERFAFVHRLRARFGIRRLCRILVTDHSNYRAWVSANARRDERKLDDQERIVWVVEIRTTFPPMGPNVSPVSSSDRAWRLAA